MSSYLVIYVSFFEGKKSQYLSFILGNTLQRYTFFRAYKSFAVIFHGDWRRMMLDNAIYG